MKLSGNKILITGGGSGIGLGLAERFAQDNTVIICGRRETVLDEARSKVPALITKACDLSTADGREVLFEWIQQEHSDVNVLVNNAGIQQWMQVTDADFYSKAKAEISINVEAPVHLASLFLKLPSLNTILNVSSGLAFVPMIRVPVYCATKAFLHSFTLSLRALVQNSGVEVIELIPPALNTDLGGKGLHDAFPPVEAFVDAVFDQLSEGREEITFGMSEQTSQADPQLAKTIFKRMNGLG
jgi:uncharacterized oxidoreductase